jgi:Ni/Co efflux regulator RcnB
MHRPPPPPYVVGRPVQREYLGYNYRIDRWHDYNLPRPRPGMFWIQYGADYLMVNPNGIVIQIWGR